MLTDNEDDKVEDEVDNPDTGRGVGGEEDTV